MNSNVVVTIQHTSQNIKAVDFFLAAAIVLHSLFVCLLMPLIPS